jgi:hypothetical protein
MSINKLRPNFFHNIGLGADFIKLYFLPMTKRKNKLECLSLASQFSLAWQMLVNPRDFIRKYQTGHVQTL